MNLQKCQQNELLFVGFNQDHICFACGTDNGFRIFTADPFKETFQRVFNKGGIGYVEMLFRCNILALIGGGRNPRYIPSKVMLWDDNQNRCIGELSYRSDVKAVKLRRDKVVVVLAFKIYVYNFSDLKLIDTIDTGANEKGLCALCPSTSNTVLACPSTQVGHVRVELYDHKKTTLITAHETALACFALSFDGQRLATASEKGTLIRIFDTYSGRLVQELRRGADKAEIYSIAFNSTREWLAVSSDRGTVHIFKLNEDGKDSGQPANNPTSTFSLFSSILPKYFASQWSFAQFKVPEVRNIVAFGQEKHSIIVVCADGTYYKAIFDPDKPGSECVQESYSKFIKSAEDE